MWESLQRTSQLRPSQWSCTGNKSEREDFWAQHQGGSGTHISIKNKKKGGKVFKHKQARKRQGDLAKMVIPSDLIIELRKKKAKKNKIQAP